MELKSSKQAIIFRAVWRSNRTFMELKFDAKTGMGEVELSSNRTFMELKFGNIKLEYDATKF